MLDPRWWEGIKLDAKVVAQDAANDLALIFVMWPVGEPLQFRAGKDIRLGDGVVVVGFPLTGLLGSGANVTTGNVSALAGIGNDTRFLQISAPVQPGNSGGPVLDMTGRLIGIVTGKLDDLKVAQITGNLPQNVNFAVKTSVIKRFLDAQSVAYEESKQGHRLDAADVGAVGVKATFLIECWR